MDLLTHLAAYVAAVDEANFSRAADRLGIAQPLLSRRIKTLEEHFGGLLFDRSRRQVTTTELGVLLVPYARDVLDRAQRLQHVARSARRSAVRVVGVPEDCAPEALARIIRAGIEHGITVAVRELPPQERESGLAEGSLAYALVRVPPESAGLRVPLGLASAALSGGTGSPGGTPPGPRRAPGAPGEPGAPGQRPRRPLRPIHLEDLRPRRSPGAAPGRPVAPALLILAEDRVPYARDRLRRAVARAGLPEGVVRAAGPTATALAETLAGRATLLCTEPFARRHGAAWAPLGDASLHRGYEPGAAPRHWHPNARAPEHPAETGETTRVPAWLVTLLQAAAGVPATPRAADHGTAATAMDEHTTTRLAARG